MKKLRVGVLFGGRSGEHEISLLSAASVLKAIDKEKYDVVPIGITKEGRWLTETHAERLLHGEPPPAESGRHLRAGDPQTTPGAGVLGSAAGMDKDVMKQLFSAAGLAIVKHVTILRSQWEKDPKKVTRMVESKLKYPLFVKPANLGSSVGISKAHDRKELGPAIAVAAGYDRKIVIEQGVGGKKQKARELECSVLGNDEPKASTVGEIIPCAEFYDYSAKYLDEGSQPVIPAKSRKKQMKERQEMAVRAFQAVDCSGLARVDFL